MLATCLTLLSFSGLAQAQDGGPGGSEGVSFTTTKVKVNELAVNYLKDLGEDAVGDMSQYSKKPGKNPNTAEYTFPNYRMVISTHGAMLAIMENLRMMRNGEPSSRTAPRFASADEAKQQMVTLASRWGGNMLSQDSSGTNGLELLDFRLVSAEDAAKLKQNGGRPFYEGFFSKRHYGFEVRQKPDYTYVAFDAKGGDLLYYRQRIEQDDLSDLNGTAVAADDALASAHKVHPLGISDAIPLLYWVFPNTAWGASAPESARGRLAYVVPYGKDEVWVDSRTGLVIGGVQS